MHCRRLCRSGRCYHLRGVLGGHGRRHIAWCGRGSRLSGGLNCRRRCRLRSGLRRNKRRWVFQGRRSCRLHCGLDGEWPRRSARRRRRLGSGLRRNKRRWVFQGRRSCRLRSGLDDGGSRWSTRCRRGCRLRSGLCCNKRRWICGNCRCYRLRCGLDCGGGPRWNARRQGHYGLRGFPDGSRRRPNGRRSTHINRPVGGARNRSWRGHSGNAFARLSNRASAGLQCRG